uniref:Kinase n=1 Tax=Anopheles maculatus TaxID=74869 RepID=A0A182SE18_9DIPT
MSQLKLPPYQKRKTSATNRPTTLNVGKGAGAGCGSQGKKSPLGYGMQNADECPSLPDGFLPLPSQVAGHAFHKGTDSLGKCLLKCVDDGSVLKPVAKLLAGPREIKFYEQIEKAPPEARELVVLRELTPQYRGNQRLPIGGELIDFLKLEDLTQGMLEPCIMDIKIGRRSWDPMATEEKRLYEASKYVESREAYGFCIPGFQFYSLQTGRLQRYGKEYGKKLTEVTVKDAVRRFLNADCGLCRQQLIQFLTDLWNIQKWARTQTSFRLYASSVLLVYDARRLKPVLQHAGKRTPRTPNTPTPTSPGSGSSTPGTPVFCTTTVNELGDVEPLQHYFKIQRNHSTNHNYEEDIKIMKENYTFMLDNLVGSYEDKIWAKARMIDFAHTF